MRTAREQHAFVNIDMESYEKKDLTLHISQQILAEDEFRIVADDADGGTRTSRA